MGRLTDALEGASAKKAHHEIEKWRKRIYALCDPPRGYPDASARVEGIHLDMSDLSRDAAEALAAMQPDWDNHHKAEELHLPGLRRCARSRAHSNS
jgi:hypothetical protein